MRLAAALTILMLTTAFAPSPATADEHGTVIQTGTQKGIFVGTLEWCILVVPIECFEGEEVVYADTTWEAVEQDCNEPPCARERTTWLVFEGAGTLGEFHGTGQEFVGPGRYTNIAESFLNEILHVGEWYYSSWGSGGPLCAGTYDGSFQVDGITGLRSGTQVSSISFSGVGQVTYTVVTPTNSDACPE